MINFTSKFLNYKDYLKYSDTWIETGSGHGGGIQRALDAGFEIVISIEAHEPNYRVCQKRFSLTPNLDTRVRLFLGESQRLLPAIMAKAPGPCVIFLDAHPSGERSYGHKELIAGDLKFGQDAVLHRELGILLKGEYRHVFILDDINGVGDAYAEMIAARFTGYIFSFFDENLSGTRLYQNKLLVAVPGE